MEQLKKFLVDGATMSDNLDVAKIVDYCDQHFYLLRCLIHVSFQAEEDTPKNYDS